MITKKVQSFPLHTVTITDRYLTNAFEKEVRYLLSLNADRLLAGFRDTAGIDMKGVGRYGGWENMLIGGHTLGHYIAACVQAYESCNASEEQRVRLLEILDYMAASLRECQLATGTGFIFGATIPDRSNIELQFDLVEQNKTNIITESWVPWYTLHKIFEGLVAMANMDAVCTKDRILTDSIRATALETASDLADWTYRRTQSWSEETHRTVLNIEYGGINDCLYDVYKLTGKPEHLAAAESFVDRQLFDRFLAAESGDDVLNNHHANTTIPKLVSVLNGYTVTGKRDYLAYAEKFWTLVTENHTYITGGNSEWEHFGRDRILDAERTNCNCETCNVYNMLKLTKLLYELTEDPKYTDWYENTFFNSILSSQNPETGMTTYFQPMATGYFKTYGEPETKFWCCVGSGMENFSKLGESFYFRSEDALIVNQYISSCLDDGCIGLRQDSSIPEGNTVRFTLTRDYNGRIMFRLPEWLAAQASVNVDGKAYDYSIVNPAVTKEGMPDTSKGWAVIDGRFGEGTAIELTLPMEVRAYNLPDGEQTYGFKYGPVVLSALLGTDDMEKSATGVDVTIPAAPVFSKTYLPSGTDTVTIEAGISPAEFMAGIGRFMLRDDNPDELRFTLTGTDSRLTFVTHYKQHRERYGLYFRFV